MDRYNRVVLEVDVWIQAVVALGFTAGLVKGGYENDTLFSIPFIIRRAVLRYPVLHYIVPRKADTGTSIDHKKKLSTNLKSFFHIKDDLRKGEYKLKSLAGAKVPRTWNATYLRSPAIDVQRNRETENLRFHVPQSSPDEARQPPFKGLGHS
ncbi:hypothetical protein PIB30_020940 [Stylosanthes scabra]|uniref:Uncharacterized protein n=1 Tax=Stylosanthes scabra TaxID=79078 RepID=A0ABU6Q8I6_9FABA|nr:hypothetical protein [Stylosanthes scabra]